LSGGRGASGRSAALWHPGQDFSAAEQSIGIAVHCQARAFRPKISRIFSQNGESRTDEE
jgi:hypothetical protein